MSDENREGNSKIPNPLKKQSELDDLEMLIEVLQDKEKQEQATASESLPPIPMRADQGLSFMQVQPLGKMAAMQSLIFDNQISRSDFLRKASIPDHGINRCPSFNKLDSYC